MKIAIHKRKESYSDRWDKWIEYCGANGIAHKVVNCYDNDIIEQLSDCDGLMWHWDLNDYKATLFAKQLTLSLEKKGLKVFPSSNTSWHYDDKVGQKYLLESINAPLMPTHVFNTKNEAFEWIKLAKFPLVFKLRGGAASINVKLVKNSKQAKYLINKAFGKGFTSRNRIEIIKDKILSLNKTPTLTAFIALIKSIIRVFIHTDVEKFSAREKGYIYFQDFSPNNDFDNRVIVMRDRCYAVRRYNRENDFRASGSGRWEFGKEIFDIKMIKLAFELSQKLNMQSVAFDFILYKDEYKLVELSYSWPVTGLSLSPGYWDSELNWHAEDVTQPKFIIEDFINEIIASKE